MVIKKYRCRVIWENYRNRSTSSIDAKKNIIWSYYYKIIFRKYKWEDCTQLTHLTLSMLNSLYFLTTPQAQKIQIILKYWTDYRINLTKRYQNKCPSLSRWSALLLAGWGIRGTHINRSNRILRLPVCTGKYSKHSPFSLLYKT